MTVVTVTVTVVVVGMEVLLLPPLLWRVVVAFATAKATRRTSSGVMSSTAGCRTSIRRSGPPRLAGSRSTNTTSRRKTRQSATVRRRRAAAAASQERPADRAPSDYRRVLTINNLCPEWRRQRRRLTLHDNKTVAVGRNGAVANTGVTNSRGPRLLPPPPPLLRRPSNSMSATT